MNIKRVPLVFHNVLSAKTRCHINDWYNGARDLRNMVIKNGLYATGPVIYQVREIDANLDEMEYTFYLPVNAPLELVENDTYSFSEVWSFEDGFVLRHADLDDEIDESYEILRECAKEFQIELQEPFFNIYLDVYGEGIIDIFAPIVKENADD